MKIVFTINKLGLVGLGATIKSLLLHCAVPSKITFYFIVDGLSESDKSNIQRLLSELQFKGKYTITHPPRRNLEGMKSKFGYYSLYNKLCIPEIITSGHVLYLDADLVVERCVSTLFQMPLNGKVLAAVVEGPVNDSLDKHFLVEAVGMKPEHPYFNSGVLLIDCSQWNQLGLSNNINGYLEKTIQTKTGTCDQVIFNALCGGDFLPLDDYWNRRHFALTPESYYKKETVVHLIDVPKPWDYFGKYINGGYALWRRYTPDFWYQAYCTHSWQKMMRCWGMRRRIMSSYVKKWQLEKIPFGQGTFLQ